MFLLVIVVLFIVSYCLSYLFFHLKSSLYSYFSHVVGNNTDEEDEGISSSRGNENLRVNYHSNYSKSVLFLLQKIVFLDYLTRLFLLFLARIFLMKVEEI